MSQFGIWVWWAISRIVRCSILQEPAHESLSGLPHCKNNQKEISWKLNWSCVSWPHVLPKSDDICCITPPFCQGLANLWGHQTTPMRFQALQCQIWKSRNLSRTWFGHLQTGPLGSNLGPVQGERSSGSHSEFCVLFHEDLAAILWSPPNNRYPCSVCLFWNSIYVYTYVVWLLIPEDTRVPVLVVCAVTFNFSTLLLSMLQLLLWTWYYQPQTGNVR